jgi:RNA polymerase sigma-70 factor (ECF subfamily)
MTPSRPIPLPFERPRSEAARVAAPAPAHASAARSRPAAERRGGGPPRPLGWTTSGEWRRTASSLGESEAEPPLLRVASDERRLEDLLARFGGLLRATIRRICPPDLGIDTQDIEQEARVRLWKALGRATESEIVASYVQKVAATSTIDAIRAALARRDRKPLADLESDADDGGAATEIDSKEATPEDLARRREVGAAIEAAVAALSPRRRRAVRLHLYGLSSPEVARLTGWSETKIRSLVSRGLAEVRRELGRKGVDVRAGN